MPSTTPPALQRASALALVLAATLTGCQSHGSESTTAATSASTSARFRCGPTDDVELTLVVPAPKSEAEAAGTLDVSIGSEHWTALQRGERRLDFAPGDAARWCMGEGRCEQPARLVFAFDRVSLEHGGELAGDVEIQLGQRTVSLPVKARVERSSQRCG